ncbi:MAG: hypothetical protein OXD46_05860 [Chloroflexi bacterium]|nr:hypothetical protein [Chloroflexota bacterium]
MALRPPRSFWLPKAGNSPEEYEDASRVVYPQRMGTSGRRTARAAVSDGASESAFAREWANVLTEAFASRPPDMCGLTEDSLCDWLALGQEEWRVGIPWDRIPWHGEAKARAGAFATLLGLTFAAAPAGSPRLYWQALAVGDSCLFVIRDDRLWLSFPLEDAAQFDNNPALVCSNPDNAGDLWENVSRSEGECLAGDLFILASDALACWFLERNAEGEKPWETLIALDSSGWAAWVEEQRGAGLMGNDDTTLVIIGVN